MRIRIRAHQIFSCPAFFTIIFVFEVVVALVLSLYQVRSISLIIPHLSVSEHFQKIQRLIANLGLPSGVEPQPHPVHVK